MKNIKFLLILFVGITFCSFDCNAQAIEMTPYDFNKIPVQWDIVSGFNVSSFDVSPAMNNLLISIPGTLGVIINNSNDIKAFKKPFMVKHKGNCYEFSAKSNNCDDCVILWKDRNGDGKIQPKKELRAVCKDGRYACKITVKKVRC